MRRRRRIPGTPGLAGQYAPTRCAQEVVDEEEQSSVLVKLGLKKPEGRLCDRQLVRFRKTMVCPVHTELVESIEIVDGAPQVNRVPLESVMPNRAARRRA